MIDPHKHGLQPYGCGCVLFRDTEVGRLYKPNYRIRIQLEGTTSGRNQPGVFKAGRFGGSVIGHQRLLPLQKGGEFAAGLEQSREAAKEFHRRLLEDRRFVAGFAPQLDIVILLPRSPSISESSALSRRIFELAAAKCLHLAVAELPIAFFKGESGG